MEVAFLIVSIIGLWFTVNAYRPLRLELLSIITFSAGWLTSELPLHHLVWQVIATAVFVAAGALEGWLGWLALGITSLSWCGLIGLAVQASRAEGVVEKALREALGDDYRDKMAPGFCVDDDRLLQLRRLVIPFGNRDPDVEKVRDIDYAGNGRRAQFLDIYRHRSRPAGCPVFLYVHGGGWVIGDKREQGLPLMLHLAARGWLCVTANYRLSPRATFPDHLIDLKLALAWVKAHISEYGGDPGYVVISGGSAGGHLCSLAALTANDPEYQPGFEVADTTVQGCVPFYGVYDFTNRDGVRGRGIGWFLERTVMKSKFSEAREAWEKASPIDRVNQGAPPFFVIHGRNDTLAPVAEARAFVRLLRASSDAPVVYAELPGAQHAFEIFRSVRTAHVVRAVERFLAYAYGNRAEAPEKRTVRA
jgi:acetyl esterase/lipase